MPRKDDTDIEIVVALKSGTSFFCVNFLLNVSFTICHFKRELPFTGIKVPDSWSPEVKGLTLRASVCENPSRIVTAPAWVMELSLCKHGGWRRQSYMTGLALVTLGRC